MCKNVAAGTGGRVVPSFSRVQVSSPGHTPLCLQLYKPRENGVKSVYPGSPFGRKTKQLAFGEPFPPLPFPPVPSDLQPIPGAILKVLTSVSVVLK